MSKYCPACGEMPAQRFNGKHDCAHCELVSQRDEARAEVEQLRNLLILAVSDGASAASRLEAERDLARDELAALTREVARLEGTR